MGSQFEVEVADRLMASGCDVELQVGTGGFFVDIGIRDPELPGRFLSGVECDGASLRQRGVGEGSGPVRQQVLEGLGWRIHRVWSTDWFQNPDRELVRVLDAVKEELSVPKERRGQSRAARSSAPRRENTDGVARDSNGNSREVELKGDPYGCPNQRCFSGYRAPPSDASAYGSVDQAGRRRGESGPLHRGLSANHLGSRNPAIRLSHRRESVEGRTEGRSQQRD